jgi:enoyl-CoA hydratase
MWAYRAGGEKAKKMLFTGDLVYGKEAEAMGLVLRAVPEDHLEETVTLLTERIKSVPINQLWMQKQMINSTIEGNLASSQRLATIFDGLTRNSPEGIGFQQMAAKHGFKAAILARDNPGKSDVYRKRWKSAL